MSSYVLDRDQLLSSLNSARAAAASATNWIDVNSNAALLGTSLYQRTTDNELRKQMADVSFENVNINTLDYFSPFFNLNYFLFF
jgi:hypothetical protein